MTLHAALGSALSIISMACRAAYNTYWRQHTVSCRPIGNGIDKMNLLFLVKWSGITRCKSCCITGNLLWPPGLAIPWPYMNVQFHILYLTGMIDAHQKKDNPIEIVHVLYMELVNIMMGRAPHRHKSGPPGTRFIYWSSFQMKNSERGRRIYLQSITNFPSVSPAGQGYKRKGQGQFRGRDDSRCGGI